MSVHETRGVLRGGRDVAKPRVEGAKEDGVGAFHCVETRRVIEAAWAMMVAGRNRGLRTTKARLVAGGGGGVGGGECTFSS